MRYNACADLLDRNVDEGRSAKLAFRDPARDLTYGALAEESCRFANALMRLGLRREERVALLMTDTVDFPIAFLGAIRAGVVPIPLNTMLGPEQYAYMLSDSRARALVVSDVLYAAIAPAFGAAPDLAHIVVAGPKAIEGRVSFNDLLSRESAAFETASDPSSTISPSGSIPPARRAHRKERATFTPA